MPRPVRHASPGGPFNSEPLAPLEFGILHTESATIEGEADVT